jgi:hypothetical protein
VPHKYKISKTSQKEAVAVGVASDWHIDEEVKSEEIGGLNEFNLDIAIKRSEIFFTRFLKLLELCRNGEQLTHTTRIAYKSLRVVVRRDKICR